jgi:hypothetical protein
VRQVAAWKAAREALASAAPAQATAREALQKLADQLDEVVNHPEYRGMFVEMHARGRTYGGPSFGPQLKAARAVLAATEQQAKVKEPKND